MSAPAMVDTSSVRADAAPDGPRGHAAPRRAWSLQTRLMVTITTAVALILVGVTLATSTIIGSILNENLRTQTREITNSAARALTVQGFGGTVTQSAHDVLATTRGLPQGFVFVVQQVGSSPNAAVISSDDTVVDLTDEQIESLAAELSASTDGRVTIDDLGSYVVLSGSVGPSHWVVGGMPTTEVSHTIARIITTTLLVTSGGLLLLGVAVAIIVRTTLSPLRSVAETAQRVSALPMAEGDVTIVERVPAAQSDDRTEFGRVGHALNTLLDHVDASLHERQRNEERMRRFVADASHELRTPLASIRGYSELSLRSPALDETTHSSLERIQAQSLRMTALVEDLLLLARLDEGRELVHGTVDLSRIAIEAVSDAQVAGTDHSWLLEVPEEPVTVVGDAPRLHQVFANLLANARTHTPAGTTVTVSVAQEGADAVLRVHDDGPGVDPAIADELFERFARGDTSRTRASGGTGLGLAIARAIVGAHEGTLTVDSRPGDTTFEVRLHASATT